MCLDHGSHGGRWSALLAFGRRGLLVVLLAAGGSTLAGCLGGEDTGLGLDLVSDEQVRELGLESWQRLLAETERSDNEAYQRTAERISDNLLRAAGEDPGAWEVVVFEGEEANAFALPANKIGIYEGMFQMAENDDQLAAVIGHEIGHVQEEHSAERLSSSVATQTGLELISAALQAGNIGYANEIASLLGVGAQYGVILPYSRNQELEADEVGLLLMAQAGYDPRAAVALWQNMQGAGANPPEFLSTHPAPQSRIAELEAMMPQALEVYQARS